LNSALAEFVAVSRRFLDEPIAHPAVAESDHFPGFNCGLERFQRILDIQDQTGKPIMIPTANVAMR
jgi:hypothetical protein